MRLYCQTCGKSVSSELPADSIIRAALTCPECIEKEPDIRQLLAAFTEKLHRFNPTLKLSGSTEFMLMEFTSYIEGETAGLVWRRGHQAKQETTAAE